MRERYNGINNTPRSRNIDKTYARNSQPKPLKMNSHINPQLIKMNTSAMDELRQRRLILGFQTGELPATMPWLASTMMAVKPTLNMALWPKLRRAKVEVVFREAFS